MAWTAIGGIRSMLYATIRVVSILLAALALTAPPAESAADLDPARIAIQVVQPPDPMYAFGKAYLVYELLLTSYDPNPVELTGLRVASDDRANRAQFNFAGDQFTSMLHPLIGAQKPAALATLSPGESRMLFVWLEFASPAAVPAGLRHYVGYKVQRKALHAGDAPGPPLKIDQSPPLAIGPPLAGDNWFAPNAPSNTSAHRTAHMVFDGTLYFSQRYAVDFVKIDASGRTYSGDPKSNASYFCYGVPALAVADGRVVEVKDGIAENTPRSGALAVEINRETVGGNHVVLDIGYGRYAFYAHLIPGSLLVNVGDRVGRGQVLGKVGNSGNSGEPHLHFHIVDGPSFMGANPSPYLFEEISVAHGRDVGGDDEVRAEITSSFRQYRGTLLLAGDAVKFPSQ
jgi:hypothetical protein